MALGWDRGQMPRGSMIVDYILCSSLIWWSLRGTEERTLLPSTRSSENKESEHDCKKLCIWRHVM